MSSPLAIAAVTATLQFFLNLVYNHPNSVLGGVSVSSVAPDLVQGASGGASAQLHVNVFLHQVTLNPAWRNTGFPALAADGAALLQNPPLALDLHYLLTAYGTEDTQAEALLGFAVLMLHENPVLPRAQIRAALAALPATNPLASVLAASGLADQIEMIKITPSTLGREEMAWLWTALKADYRPTFPFQVSVVLIEPTAASPTALPVLSRNLGLQSGPPPQLFQLAYPNHQPTAFPGDLVTLNGIALAGATQVALLNSRTGARLTVPLASVTDNTATFPVPDDPANFPAGPYTLALLFTGAGNTILRTAGPLTLAVAAAILPLPAPTAVTSADGTLITLTCKPQLLPSQSVTLILGPTAITAKAFAAPTATISFPFPTLTPGPYLARLNVDGIESPPIVNWDAIPPSFTGPFLTV